MAQGFDNYLATWMGFSSADEISLDSLRERYRFIRIQEHFHESLVILSRVLNCPVEVLWHEQVRVNEKKPDIDVAPEIRELFYKNNALDQKLYELSLGQLEIDIREYVHHFERDCEQLTAACQKMSQADPLKG